MALCRVRLARSLETAARCRCNLDVLADLVHVSSAPLRLTSSVNAPPKCRHRWKPCKNCRTDRSVNVSKSTTHYLRLFQKGGIENVRVFGAIQTQFLPLLWHLPMFTSRLMHNSSRALPISSMIQRSDQADALVLERLNLILQYLPIRHVHIVKIICYYIFPNVCY